jgi:hypothetical protein
MTNIDVWIQRPRGTCAEYAPPSLNNQNNGAMVCKRVLSLPSDFTEGILLDTRIIGADPLFAFIVFPEDDDPGLQPGAIITCRTLGCVRVRYWNENVRNMMILTPITNVMSSASIMEEATQFSEYHRRRLQQAAVLYMSTSSVLTCDIESASDAEWAYLTLLNLEVD